MKKWVLGWRTLILLGVLLVSILLSSSQGDAQQSIYWHTVLEAPARECPTLDCEIIFTYPPLSPLNVEEIVTGDSVADVAEWVKVVQPYTNLEGYIHRNLTSIYEPQAWETYPVTPLVSDTAKAIYQRGLAMGNDPHAFSKVGDCQNVSSYFLYIYDQPGDYRLGDYADLQATIDHFLGSWSRDSESVDNGFNVASVLSPLWADPAVCESGESPLECEYRLHKPSIAIISMETWWGHRPAEEYENYLHQIVDFWIAHGVVPILATKADNLEGDNSINAAIIRTAAEYDIPVWNFWLAVQPLPEHGLTTDNFHLTFARNFFDDPERLERGWPIRNLSALQAIDAVLQAVSEEQE